jgi:homocitrate synthase
LETKIKIAKAYVYSFRVNAGTNNYSLDAFGVEYIELTSPAASPESRAHCEAICKLGLKRTKILTHIRCHMDDARIAVETGMSLLTFRLVKMLIIGVDGVDVVIGTSSFLREHSHGKDMTWITKTSAISSSNATKS